MCVCKESEGTGSTDSLASLIHGAGVRCSLEATFFLLQETWSLCSFTVLALKTSSTWDEGHPAVFGNSGQVTADVTMSLECLWNKPTLESDQRAGW